VSVSYVKPEDFADVPRNAIDRERVLKDFSSYFDTLVRSCQPGRR
jgi:hypothetical protein